MFRIREHSQVWEKCKDSLDGLMSAEVAKVIKTIQKQSTICQFTISFKVIQTGKYVMEELDC